MILARNVVAIRSSRAYDVAVQFSRADPEMNRVGRVPDENFGRVFRGASVHRLELRESRESGSQGPHRLVEPPVHIHRAVEPGNADAGLVRPTVVSGVGNRSREKEAARKDAWHGNVIVPLPRGLRNGCR